MLPVRVDRVCLPEDLLHLQPHDRAAERHQRLRGRVLLEHPGRQLLRPVRRGLRRLVRGAVPGQQGQGDGVGAGQPRLLGERLPAAHGAQGPAGQRVHAVLRTGLAGGLRHLALRLLRGPGPLWPGRLRHSFGRQLLLLPQAGRRGLRGLLRGSQHGLHAGGLRGGLQLGGRREPQIRAAAGPLELGRRRLRGRVRAGSVQRAFRSSSVRAADVSHEVLHGPQALQRGDVPRHGLHGGRHGHGRQELLRRRVRLPRAGHHPGRPTGLLLLPRQGGPVRPLRPGAGLHPLQRGQRMLPPGHALDRLLPPLERRNKPRLLIGIPYLWQSIITTTIDFLTSTSS
mmetsp:Transcript_18893/g.26021  ORF Transcript_18893/g.26021 Transcript_18893/m.26021 type:complete len:341 (-) Transcript_18893:36-1058(-)